MKIDWKAVQDHYSKIAEMASHNGGPVSCCQNGASCCSALITDVAQNYDPATLRELPLEAVTASLGCANPVVLADLREGETVLDLGSGGGMDVLAAARLVGDKGKVYGLDMTDEMLALANANKQRMGAENVEFLKGFIEDIPLPDESVDVVMSNCVINLTPDKGKALKEAYRVLKKGGRLAIADIVAVREVPPALSGMVELWVSCIGGALPVDEYVRLLEEAGFTSISVEPVQYYSREMIAEMTNDKLSISEKEWEELDRAFASAYVKGVK